ncbi:unnamed protein product [Rotaria sp. Silwood1]|nr:unnamed protein product [Rotaria sp. Silwood1]
MKLNFRTHIFQVKPLLTHGQSSQKEAKKFRRTNDDKELVSCFENLSNELIYEILDYLDGYKLYKAFSNLNNRFEALIKCSSYRLKVDLRFQPEPILEYWSICIILPNKHRIISLSLDNILVHNSYLTLFNINSSFSQLQSLTLGSIMSEELIPLLISLNSLPHLSSLYISYCKDVRQVSNIYQRIFNLPMLKYYKFSFFDPEWRITLSITINEQFSGIKYLVIDHFCTLDEIITILLCTPQLCRLTCKQVDESKKIIVIDALKTIFSLTRISISKCYANCDELEMFLINISPQLQVLRINTFRDVTYLDANRWERIISQHLLYLNIFEFQYEESIYGELEVTDYHESLNKFNSLFWIKRKWFFKISIDTHNWNTNFIVYSIFPYRPIRGNSHEDKEDAEIFNNDIGQNMMHHSIIPNEQDSITSSEMLFETNQSMSLDLRSTTSCETLFDIIGRISLVIQTNV